MESSSDRRLMGLAGGKMPNRPIAKVRLRGSTTRATEHPAGVEDISVANKANRIDEPAKEGLSSERSLKRFHSVKDPDSLFPSISSARPQTSTVLRGKQGAFDTRGSSSRYVGLVRKQQSESAVTSGGHTLGQQTNALMARGELSRTTSRGSLQTTSTTPTYGGQTLRQIRQQSKPLPQPPPQQQRQQQQKSACEPVKTSLKLDESPVPQKAHVSVSKPGFSGEHLDRNGGVTSPAISRSGDGLRAQRSPVAEPVTYKSQSLRGISRIPRPAIHGQENGSSASLRYRQLLDSNQYLKEQLAKEREAVNVLLREIKTMAAVTESLNAKLDAANAATEAANIRADRAETQLRNQRTENAALKQKIVALNEVVRSQSDICGNGLPSPNKSRGVLDGIPGLQGDSTESATSDYQRNRDVKEQYSDHARIVAGISAIHAACTLAQPEAEMSPSVRRDLCTVEHYLQTVADSQTPNFSETNTGGVANDTHVSEVIPAPLTMFSPPTQIDAPQQRWVAEQEERVMRRRSSMLFAGLIRPSVASTASPGRDQALPLQTVDITTEFEEDEQLACGRCKQLLETMHALEIDNDYYREANKKLRDSTIDIISRHNALVHVFERERSRRMDARASALARTLGNAVRDRAQLEAQQRAEINDIEVSENSERSGAMPSLGVAY
ncbi:hypothetical protein IWW48_004513 [Coemansia sp. RSA 1200]|nr:hypothetical protein IWW48_004513 [Coemansia sp. RSA 1200]